MNSPALHRRLVPYLSRFLSVSVLCVTVVGGAAQAGSILAEWNPAETRSAPSNLGFFAREELGVFAKMEYDPTIEVGQNQGAMKVEVQDPGSSDKKGKLLLFFAYKNGVVGGKDYKITVLLKATKTTDIGVRVIQDSGDFVSIGVPSSTVVTVGEDWQEVVFKFTANDGFSDQAIRVPNLELGNLEQGEKFYVASWKFEEAE